MRALIINVGEKEYYEEEFEGIGVLEYALYKHNKKKSYSKDVYNEDNVVVFGCGPLAGRGVFGANRLTFVFRSPLTRGLYTSTLGGAGIFLYRTGYDAVCIEGRSENPIIIGISDKGVKFEEVEKIEDYENFEALAREKLKSFFETDFCVASAGKGGLKTDFGCIKSGHDFAGRGGAGSVLIKAHNVLAVAFGGTLEKEKVNFTKYVSHEEILKGVEKYRYNEKIGSGGTFGCNYPTLKLWTEYNNWRMIYDNNEKRKEVFEKIIGKDWWKEFNKEVIEKKTWKTCWEPCPALCKKFYGDIKVDYEPFQGLGPNLMIFDIKKVKELVKIVDENCLDAIETGNVVSFFLEAEEVGAIEISGRDRFEKAKAVIEEIILEGIDGNLRTISKEMNLKDIAVYVPYGDEGAITPNYYWSLGVFFQVPVPGRYWTYYKFGEYLEPEDLAAKCFENGIYECLYDDFGICRFHRKWIKGILDKLLREIGIKENIEERGKRILKEVYEYNLKAGAKPVFWESKRVIDIIEGLAKEHGKEIDAKEYWERFWEKYNSLVEIK